MKAASSAPRFAVALAVKVGACARTPGPVPSKARPPHTVEPESAVPPGRWVRIIATNDFHGTLDARLDSSGVFRGGAGPLSAEIARARRECPAPRCVSILLDGGDEFQGTLPSNFTYGRSVVEIFNR